MSFKFTKQAHLIYSNDFKKIIKYGKRKHNNWFFVCFIENTLDIARLGIIVKKVIVKKAVHRNRIKRIIRETFRLNNEKIKKSLDIVIILRENIYAEKQKKIDEALIEIWQNCGII